jgi:hypothetical protein
MSDQAEEVRCTEAERVCLYAMHALPASEVAGVESHLSSCAKCQREIQMLRRLVGSFAAWPADVLNPPNLWGRLAERIGADAGGHGEPSATPSWSEPPWEEVSPGICCKLLATDSERARVSMLVRLAPGVEYPPHHHSELEELHLLDGELWINDRKLCPGDYSRAERGTADERVWSETGCTCVLITSTEDVLD